MSRQTREVPVAEMSPVELLRAAAARVREIGAAATGGPWWSDQSEQCYRLHGVHAKLPPAWPGLPEQVMNRQILKAPKTGTPYAEYWPSPADDAWMTTVHPGLAEPLAALLDAEAYRVDRLLNGPSGDGVQWAIGAVVEQNHGPALRLARGVLGVPDGRCLACPPDCRECSKDESDCECYTHQDNHPDDIESAGVSDGR